MRCHILSFFLLLSSVRSDYNITVDDGSPSVVYRPPDSWNVSSQTNLNIGGYHKLTVDSAAIANFTFTGVAVYFMSPRWPYRVNTQISLDSGAPILLDLVDHSRPDARQGSETVQSEVIWGASNLSNTRHSLVMSVGPGQPYAIVDALMYTVPGDGPGGGPSSASPAGSSDFGVSASPSVTSGNSEKKTSSHTLAVVVGIVAGVCGLILIALVLFICKRRKPEHSRRPIYAPGPVDRQIPLQGAYVVASHKPQSPMMSMPGAMPPVAYRDSQFSNTSTTGSDVTQWPGQNSPNPLHGHYGIHSIANSTHPNTLSTITETSSPLGGTASLIHASSFQSGLTTNDTKASQASIRSGMDSGMNTQYGVSQQLLSSSNRIPAGVTVSYPPPYE